MENQTRFDLTAAIQTWQQELAAQPNLTMEARRELETHVRDTVAELQRAGLNDEESFWLARRRVGRTNELGEEFGKADPAKPYREAVLWIAIAFFALHLWVDLFSLVRLVIFPPARGIDELWFSQVHWILVYLPVAWLAVSVARGRFIAKIMAWRSIIRSRRRFLMVACFSLLAIKSVTIAIQLVRMRAGATLVWASHEHLWLNLMSILSSLVWPIALIAIIFWLLPAEESRTFKRALQE